MSKKLKQPTKIQDLAELAKVSASTVSRALSGSELVNEKTRARIVALAEKHNYKVNETARNFRLKKTNVIAVVMMLDSNSKQQLASLFNLELLGAIATALSSHGYDLLLSHAPTSDIRDMVRSRVYRQSDGVIFIGQGQQHDGLNELAKLEKPIVVWGAQILNKDYCTVGTDNELGGYLATKHLLNLGRRRLVFLGDIDLPESNQRWKGYMKALKEKGLEADRGLLVDVFGMDRARLAIDNLLQQKTEFDGIVCCSDLIAMSAMGVLVDSGVKIPDEVAVVGYDDIVLASYSAPALTTVRQNIAQGGRVLVHKILTQINGGSVGDSVLSTELVVRRSSGAW